MNQKKTKVFLAMVLTFCMLLTLPGVNMSADAASAKTKKISGITYKITNSKKKTAEVSKASKSIKTAKIAATVKIKGKTYKVTSVSKNAFKNCKKLTKVTVGKNVKTISANAFYGAKKLSSVTFNTTSLTKIGNNAFKGIKKTAKFYVPKSKLSKYKKLIKKKKVGWKSTMKIVAKSSGTNDSGSDSSEDSNKDSTDSSDKVTDPAKYSYSVTPLTDNVCYYFYVKTDNPDPKSFRFVDEDTSMTDSGKCNITRSATEYADVVYTDVETLRVNGGYIFYSSKTDGGKWTLEVKIDGKYETTNQCVTVPKLTSSEGYLIEKYTTASMSFFEKMSAVQSGLSGICFYSGVYVLGQQQKSTTSPYYGLSTSPHIDQTFYIQDPYYRLDNRTMLVSSLYPYRLDSIGFPSEMAAVAKALDSTASCKWNANYHWLVDVTYNGETKSYGGAGGGGGQGITSDMVKYKYRFDGSAGDTFSKRSWDDLRSMITEYGEMTVKEEEKDLPELTWQEVSDTVGVDGSYVKLVLLTSIYGGTGSGYTFLYKNGSSSSPGYFSNAWYDGRYFNSYEFFEKGTTFENEKASTATIIVKDAKISFPEAPEGMEYLYNYTPVDKLSNYDAATGVWSGFMRYNYDKDSGTWIASVYTGTTCRNKTTYQYYAVDDEDFKAACTLTLEDVKAMGIDRNANSDPASYYNYDMTVPPGTKVN